MSRFRFSRTPDGQVDPFNAGDPVMPGSESEWALGLDDETLGSDDGSDEDVSYAPHGEEGGSPHKSGDNYQAPTTRGHSYDAPSIEGDSGAQTDRGARSVSRQWQRAMSRARREKGQPPQPDAAGRATRHRRALMRTMIIVIILISLLGSLLPMLASCVGSIVDDILFDEPAPDYTADFSFDWVDSGAASITDAVEEQEEQAAREAVRTSLEGLLADPTSGELHDRLVDYLNDELDFWGGYTAAELGIDADAWVAEVISATTVEVSDVYLYGDGTGGVYATLDAPNAGAMSSEAGGDIYSYLLEHELEATIYGKQELTEEQRSEVRAIWDAAVAAVEPQEPWELSYEVTGAGENWELNTERLWSNLETVYSLY